MWYYGLDRERQTMILALYRAESGQTSKPPPDLRELAKAAAAARGGSL